MEAKHYNYKQKNNMKNSAIGNLHRQIPATSEENNNNNNKL